MALNTQLKATNFVSNYPDYARPVAVFKTLRRLHGHNLEDQGLNNLSEAFQAFVTRAKFFSIGHFRRTWSHSAVEFLKYRRLLPMLTANDADQSDTDVHERRSTDPTLVTELDNNSLMEKNSKRRKDKGHDRKITVTNLSPRVTLNQLTAFFSKFGEVSSCHMPLEERRKTMYATLPRNPRTTGIAHITFKKKESADKAKNASSDELKFYDRVMSVTPYISSRIRASSTFVSTEKGTIFKLGSSYDESSVSYVKNESAKKCEPSFSLSDVASLFGRRVSLEHLPPRALERVISFLPPVDRIRLERVNKTWLESAAKSWVHCGSLSFSANKCLQLYFSASRPLRNCHLTAFLRRCGPNLMQIDLSGVNHLLDDSSFAIISSFCPNLEVVDISGVSGSADSLRAFSESLPRLRSLAYRDMVNIGEKSFWFLIRGCTCLTKVDFRGCRRLRGRCFRLFSSTLEILLLDGCCRVDEIAIEDLCVFCPNLRILSLNGCSQLTEESISLISRKLTEMEEISFCGDNFGKISKDGLLPLANLTTLSELRIEFNSAVSGDLLEVISSGIPQLKLLSIAYAGTDTTIDESALLTITQLEKLQALNISGIASVTNVVLEKIAKACVNLRDVFCKSCTYLGDAGVIALSCLKYLQHVDISGCLLISTEAIQALADAFQIFTKSNKKDKNVAVAITVVIGGTMCDPRRLRLQKSRVVVDQGDYSELSSTAAGGLLSGPSYILDVVNESDEDVSGDEFEALAAHRSFIIDALRTEEDDSPLDNLSSVSEWAEREAVSLGLISKDE